MGFLFQAGSETVIIKSDDCVLKLKSENLPMENYYVLPKYHKCIVPPLTWMVGPTMNLLSKTHHSYEMREYTFMIQPAQYSDFILFFKMWVREIQKEKISIIYLGQIKFVIMLK